MGNDKNEKRQANDANHLLRLDHYVNRVKRDTGISESQAIALAHRFGADRSAIRSAATKLASFAK